MWHFSQRRDRGTGWSLCYRCHTDWHASDRGRRELLNDIATATGEKWKVVFGQAADYAGGKIGPGLLIKESVLNKLGFKNVTTVPIAGREKRILIIAEFEKFVFIATHLDTILKEKFVIKSATEGTLPAQPNQNIDYILYDANGTDFINFEESHVVKSFLFGESLERLDTVSDHYPVILDINLK